MGWIWPVCFDKGHGWDNVPAALSYSPPKNQRSLENLWFFLLVWVESLHMSCPGAWDIQDGQGFCLTSPSGLKYFRPQFTSDESKSSKVIHKTNIGKHDIRYIMIVWPLFFRRSNSSWIVRDAYRWKRMTAPNVVLMENGFKSFNPFQCQERNESLLSVRDTIFALDHRARISQHWTGALRQLWLLWSLENCRHQWLRARLGLRFVDESCGLFGWEWENCSD